MSVHGRQHAALGAAASDRRGVSGELEPYGYAWLLVRRDGQRRLS
jgi:hypothetical protein